MPGCFSRFLPLVLMVLVSGLAPGLCTGATALDDARTLREQGELLPALVKLKDYLAGQPQDIDARVLIAQVHLDLYQGAAAEKELQMAREAGASREQVLVPLVRALLLQGDSQAATNAILLAEPGDDRTQALHLALRGEAMLAVNDYPAAAGMFTEALALDPAQARALAGQARLALADHRLDDATALIKQATAADPNWSVAWELAGEIEFASGDLDAAEAALIKAELVGYDKWMPRFKRAVLHIERGELERAATDLDRVEEGFPNFSGLLFARGALALRKGDTAGGITALREYLKRDPTNPRAIYLLGVGEAIRGNLELAEASLRKYHQALPQALDGVLALAQVLVARNQLPEADGILGEYIDAATASGAIPAAGDALSPIAAGEGTSADTRPAGAADPAAAAPAAYRAAHQALHAQAEVKLRMGQPAAAVDLLARAVAAMPGKANYRIAYAEALLAVGKRAEALPEIDRGAELAPANLAAQLLRIKVRLALEQFPEALKMAETLARMHPQDPYVQNALALAQIGSGHPEMARQSFRAAMDAQPGHADAALNLGRLLVRDGDPNEARQVFEEVLAAQPGHLEATLALADLDGMRGDRLQQIDRLDAALRAAPESLAARIALARALLANAEGARALTLIQGALANQRRVADLLLLQGEAELALGKHQDAVETYRTLVAVLPDAAAVHYLLARAAALAGEVDPMQASLLRAVALDPGHALAPTAMDLVFARLADGAQRLALADRLIEASGNDPRMIAQKAELLVAAGDPAAAEGLIAGLATQHPDDTGVLAKLVQMQLAAGATAEAIKTLQDWAQRHPEDSAPQVLMAQAYVAQGDEAKALVLLSALAERFPGNALILNNTAWLLRTRDPQQALLLAERALRLQPKDPQVMDTLGALLLEQGRTERALDLLDQAHGLDETDPAIAYHYARALIASGRAAEARNLLLGILDRPFAEQAQARQLLGTLGGNP